MIDHACLRNQALLKEFPKAFQVCHQETDIFVQMKSSTCFRSMPGAEVRASRNSNSDAALAATTRA